MDVVGHKGGGKTSFLNRLKGKPFDKVIESTEGIATQLVKSRFGSQDEIEPWIDSSNSQVVDFKDFNKVVKSKANEQLVMTDTKLKNKLYQKLFELSQSNHQDTQDYSVSLWDFGGGDQFLVTNQFSLYGESLALLVLDMTKNLDDDTDSTSKVRIPKTPAGFLHFWLNTIHKQSLKKNFQPNVALVLTHRDLIPEQESQEYIKAYINDIMRSLNGKAYSNYITIDDINIVDNKNGTDKDFDELRRKLFQRMMKQRSWGMKRPVKWLKLDADLRERAKKQNTKYLYLSTVTKLASNYNMKETDIESFLKFQHTMGDFVYYPEVNGVVIIEPQWFIDKFKSLITDHTFLNKMQLKFDMTEELNKGVVSRNTLELLWKGNDVNFLVELMKKLSLIMPLQSSKIEEKGFLIPVMLPKTQLKVYEDEPFKSMIMVYNSLHEAVMSEDIPIGIFHQIISRCGNYLQWKVFEDDHLSYTDVSFRVQRGVRVALTLLEKNIRVSVWADRDIGSEKLHLSLPFIRESLVTQMSVSGINETNNFLIQCPHSAPGQQCLIKVKQDKNPDGTSIQYILEEKKCLGHGKPVTKEDLDWLIQFKKEVHPLRQGKFSI